MPIKNVVKVLVFDAQDKILLLKRSDTDDYEPSRLDFPGGGVDEGESFSEAVSRELFEEAGITVDPKQMRLTYAGTVWDTKINKSVNRVLFACRVHNNSVVLSDEHSDFMWVDVDEALTIFPHPFYSEAIRHATTYQLLPK